MASPDRWFFYLVRCNHDALYAGVCRDVLRRVAEHNAGTGGRYTRSHGPVRLVYWEEHASRSEAQRREAEVKKWPKERKERLAGRREDSYKL